MNNASNASHRTIAQSTAYVLAVFSMAIWGSPPVVTRAVSGDVPPLALSLSRWLIAALLLLPFVWRKLPREWALVRPQLGALTLLAIFMTGGSSLSVLAVYYTTATNAVLVNASQPAITAVVAWLIAREGLNVRQRFGIGAAFLGILVMICRADLGVLLSLDINIGDPIMLMAVVGWSLYAVSLHRHQRLPSSDVLLFLISVTGTLLLLPMYLVEAYVTGPFELGGKVFGAMIYLALFPTLLATYFWNLCLKSIGANRAAIFINLIPIFGASFAMIFLGERLFTYHFIGAAMVFAGIYLSVRR